MSGCWICAGATAPCARFAPQPFSECERCGFVFRTDLDDEALRRVYSDGAYEELRGDMYTAELADRRREARVRLRYVEPWVRSGALLDVGAAGGAFLIEAQAAGFEVSGVEPVPSFARAARERLGLDVRDGGIEDMDMSTPRYRAITLWHVLEHLPEPLRHLRRLAGALTQDGVLAVEVPNAASAVAEHMGSAWPMLEPAVHVNQFTPASLRRALELAQLEVCELGTTAITPYRPALARMHARHVLGRAKAAVWLHDPRPQHPSGHELLRAVARRG